MKHEINTSFSKLKIIKNYFRFQISWTRIVGLAMISIEKKIYQTIRYDGTSIRVFEIKSKESPFSIKIIFFLSYHIIIFRKL